MIKNDIFDIQINNITGDTARDLAYIKESLFKAQQAIFILANIIAEQNRPAIESLLGLEPNKRITEVNLTAWSNTL
jgi:hypothetical protein